MFFGLSNVILENAHLNNNGISGLARIKLEAFAFRVKLPCKETAERPAPDFEPKLKPSFRLPNKLATALPQHRRRMSYIVKENILSNPIDISFLSFVTVMPNAHQIPNIIKQF